MAVEFRIRQLKTPLKMPARWNEETTVKFVKLYKEKECLWNMSNSLYKNKLAREQAIMQMVDVMGVPGFGLGEARNKIKNLRTTYTQELTKIEKSLRSDCKADELYVPALKWFDIMDSCIRDFLVRKSTSANPEEPVIDDSIYIKEEEPYEVIFDTMSREEEDSNQYEDEICPSKAKRPKLSEITISAPEQPTLQRSTVSVQPIVPHRERALRETECSIFGKHISMQLSKLTTKNFILAQQDIQEVLTRYRLKDYDDQLLSPNVVEFNNELGL